MKDYLIVGMMRVLALEKDIDTAVEQRAIPSSITL
jgi:hypothetical protein